MAEDGGFAAFWTGEHYGMEFTVGPDPLTLLVHLAAQTRSIRLVTGNIVAPFWHPVRLASEAALADVLTNGRIELGIARGAYQFEFDRLMDGMSAMQGGSHLREMVPLLQQLWAGDVEHAGENWSFPTATSVPKPVQAGGPAIWIAARDPASHDFAVANGCDVCCTPLAKDDTEVEDLVAKFETACAAHPEIPRPRLMMLRHAFVVERDDQVADAARAVKDWYAYFEKWIRNDGSVRARPHADARRRRAGGEADLRPRRGDREQPRRHARHADPAPAPVPGARASTRSGCGSTTAGRTPRRRPRSSCSSARCCRPSRSAAAGGAQLAHALHGELAARRVDVAPARPAQRVVDLAPHEGRPERRHPVRLRRRVLGRGRVVDDQVHVEAAGRRGVQQVGQLLRRAAARR